MAFEFRPAARRDVSLLVGLSGGTGSGKTFTAMRLAKGISGDKPFAVIDTEAGRANHYADQFRFDHGDLKPPFTPERYTEAIRAADKAGYVAIVVDSGSHEWAGEGGILDFQEKELDRMTGDGDWKKREACRMASWIKPKMAHKKMVSSLLQVRAHLILCFRAEPKVEMVKGEGGKMEVRAKESLTGVNGWIPVCEKSLPYELTVSFLLMADHPGIPIPIKLQEQHRGIFPKGSIIDETSGLRLAEWARGGGAGVAPSVGAALPPAAAPKHDAVDWPARIAAARTKPELLAINRELNRIKNSMPASALAVLRTAYNARLEALSDRKPKPDAAPLTQNDIPWGTR